MRLREVQTYNSGVYESGRISPVTRTGVGFHTIGVTRHGRRRRRMIQKTDPPLARAPSATGAPPTPAARSPSAQAAPPSPANVPVLCSLRHPLPPSAARPPYVRPAERGSISEPSAEKRTPFQRRPAFLAAPTAALAALLATAAAPLGAAAESCSTNAALGRPAQASSTQGGFPAAHAVDDSGATRWGSEWVGDAWIEIDLGSVLALCRVDLDWEGAYGKAFRVQTSDQRHHVGDGGTVTNGTGGVQTHRRRRRPRGTCGST